MGPAAARPTAAGRGRPLSPHLGSWWRKPWPATSRTRSPTATGSSTAGPTPAGPGHPASAPRPPRSQWSTGCAATTAPGPNGWRSSTSWACPPSARPATARRSTPSSCSTEDRRPWPSSGSRPSPTQPAPSKWITWIWLHWYVALRAEAAVLAADPHARSQLAAASTVVAGNPIATAIVQRAEALLGQDRQQLLAAGAALDAAGCPYQAARTLILAGGAEAERRGGAHRRGSPPSHPRADTSDQTRRRPSRLSAGGRPATR